MNKQGDEWENGRMREWENWRIGKWENAMCLDCRCDGWLEDRTLLLKSYSYDENNFHGLGPRSRYTDRATAASRRS
jgi:hypothetical protein